VDLDEASSKLIDSFLVMFGFVDNGRGVVRSISASISEISSEKPLVIVVSPVFDVLKCPPVLP
jgi:hypothetical protein